MTILSLDGNKPIATSTRASLLITLQLNNIKTEIITEYRKNIKVPKFMLKFLLYSRTIVHVNFSSMLLKCTILIIRFSLSCLDLSLVSFYIFFTFLSVYSVVIIKFMQDLL